MAVTEAIEVPYSEASEVGLLGAAMLWPEAAELVANDVMPLDFYRPTHQTIAEAQRKLIRSGHRCDWKSIEIELESRPELNGSRPDSSYLNTLMVNTERAAVPRFAQEVLECSARRAVMTKNRQIRQAAADRQVPMSRIGELSRELAGTAEMPLLSGEVDPDIVTFLAGQETYDWLVPGLLERGDRLILTGGEGYGKTWMLRQVAMSIAAGLHPFTHTSTDAASVLILDCENGEAQTRRVLRNLHHQAVLAGHRPRPENLRVIVRPGGMDLLNRADERWLYERMEADRPDVVCMGPLYKLAGGNPNDEEPAKEVSRVLDAVRSRWGCALIIEAHAPHGQAGAASREMRPYGASLWRRWPEFGFGIVPTPNQEKDTAELVAWRGPREERSWPKRLKRGGSWPWTEAP